jgi:hypothetical protein
MQVPVDLAALGFPSIGARRVAPRLPTVKVQCGLRILVLVHFASSSLLRFPNAFAAFMFVIEMTPTE